MLKFSVVAAVMLFSGLAAFAAKPDAEALRLREENRALRAKLLESEKELAEYRIWLGHLVIDHQKISVTAREARLMHILNELSQRGNSLSMAALTVREECRKLLQELPVGPVRKAQVELRLDELERSAGSFAALTVPGNSYAGDSRILAVNKDLKVVVLSAGSGAGVFPGMVFSCKKKSALKFRVISVRFDGALAELLSGKWQDVVIGMEVSALHQTPSQRRSILSL